MDGLAIGQTGRAHKIYCWNTTSPLHLISVSPTNSMNVYVFTCLAPRGILMFQHKIKESVQYKELCIVRHILCVKSIYFDLHGPVGVCSGDNFFSLKSGVDESCQYLPNFSYCSFRNKENTTTNRCRTTCSAISAVSCTSSRVQSLSR